MIYIKTSGQLIIVGYGQNGLRITTYVNAYVDI